MTLPTPPNRREKYLYVDQDKWTIYPFGLLSFGALTAGMVLFSFAHDYTVIYLGFALLVFLYLGAGYFIGVFGKSFDIYEHNEIRDRWSKWQPTIDIFLPTCGEPIEVLENTYLFVRALDWPEHLLRVYVLDDAGRKEVAILAERFEFDYIVRPNRGELKKAGNIRYAFKQSQGEFIVILDADFAPRPDFLRELVPYFAENPKIAIVQSPQFFDVNFKQNWIERGAGYIQELFYRLVQVNRNTWDASICVGTCAIYRRRALMPFGGTYPIEYSEDMHTGWWLTVNGWVVRYVPINLSKGLCPDSMRAFFVQQLRWCTGSTSLLFSRKFWTHRLGFMQRLCYMSGMSYYIATAMAIFLTPFPALVMVWFFPEKVFWYNYLFSFPSFLFGILIFPLWSRFPFGLYVLTARQVSFYAHFYALLDKFKGSIVSWVPTGDSKAMARVGRYFDFKSMLFAWTSLVTFLAIAGAFYHMSDLGDWNFWPIIFFSSLNYVAAMAALRDEA